MPRKRYTLQDALDLKQAGYAAPEALPWDTLRPISVDGDGLVAVTPDSRYNAIANMVPVADCSVLGVENLQTGAMLMAHKLPGHEAEALGELIRLARRNRQQNLRVHCIGCIDHRLSREEWEQKMEGLVEVVSRAPNAELGTFDMGHKPHPLQFVFVPAVGGGRFAALTGMAGSAEEMEHVIASIPMEATLDIRAAGRTITPDYPCVANDFISTAEAPVQMLYDGRGEMQGAADKPKPPRRGGPPRSK